jgi:fucose 4-O-acetylase-like acetyltransferase
MTLLGAGGVAIFFLSRWLDARPVQLYAVYDYWHTSPNFFLARLGILLLLMLAAYAWCRWGLGAAGFSPFAQLGQTSLLVYWVHTEFVYGRFSILDKRAQSIPMATLGLIVITTAMVLLSIARTRSKGRGKEIVAWFRRIRSGEVGRTPGAATEG